MMKLFAVACLVLACCTGSALATSPNHCESGEEVLWNCAIQNSRKLASLCGITNREAGSSMYIQYRFGLPGKIEFQFPAARKLEDVMNRFRINDGYNAQFIRLTSLGFENHGYIYEMWFEEERLRGARSRRSASLVTFRSGKRGGAGEMHEFKCKNANEPEVELMQMYDIVKEFSSPGIPFTEQQD